MQTIPSTTTDAIAPVVGVWEGASTIAAGVELDGEPCPWSDRVGILLDLALGGIVTATFVMSRRPRRSSSVTTRPSWRWAGR